MILKKNPAKVLFKLLKPGKKYLLMVLFILQIFPLHAQYAYASPKAKRIGYLQKEQPGIYGDKLTLNVKNEKLVTVLEKIEKQIKFIFVYANDDIDVKQKTSVTVSDKSLQDILKLLLIPLGINFTIVKDKIILQNIIQKSPLAAGSDGKTIRLDKTVTAETKYFLPITGKITDENGSPLQFVNVIVKGTGIGTTSNTDGNFSLNIPDDKLKGTLVLSLVGFITEEISIAGKNNFAVTLKAVSKDLADIVVVGYGTQQKISVSGAVDAIGKKSFEGRPLTNLSTALQGVSPNLIIQQRNFEPGQRVNINIRGLGTLGDNTPLVVIDGLVGGDINLLNPVDIENISILKDAGSAAIYGSRSANGVILITTKKGKKNSTPVVRYSGTYGIQAPRITYKPVAAWENAYYKNESLNNAGLSPAFSPAQIQQFKNQGDGDWRVDNIFQNAPQQSHNVSVSGGGVNNTYLLSLGYLDQKNNFIGPNYGYKRYNVRLNQSNDIGKLKVNTILSYAKVINKDQPFDASTLIVDASRVPLYYSFKDSAGNYLTNPVSAQYNPKAILENGGERNSNNDEIFGNFSGEYAINNDLKIRAVFGGTVGSNTTFSAQKTLNFTPGGAFAPDRPIYDENSKSLFTNVQLLAEYNKKIAENHNLKVLVGASNESFKIEASRVQKTFVDPNLGVPTTGTIVSTLSYNSVNGTTETSLNSLFGRVGYSYKDRYFVEGNARYDGSSKFAKDKRFGFFPSGSIAWRVTEEEFLNNVKSRVGDIKLRASYGVLGNQNVNAYQYQTTFFNYDNAYGFNNNVVGGSGYSLGNPNLTWEKAATFNAGLDAGLFKGALSFSIDYFNKTTSDILYPRLDIPLLFGAGSPDFNIAKVRNKGWEAKGSYNLTGKNFKHTFSFNVADNLNELISLASGATEFSQQVEEFALLRRVGQPITTYYGYRSNGYFQNLNDIKNSPNFVNRIVSPGDLKFVDKNGDGIIDEKDKFILGNPFPRYTFGFTYNVLYKGFDFSAFIQGVGKRDAMIRGEQVEPFHFGYGGTMYTHQTDYWTPTNPNAANPKIAEAGSPSNANNYRTGSDRFLFNAAYARLKNVQFGYTLPAKYLTKLKAKSLRVYFTAQNLLTLSKLNFLDPEITEFDNNTTIRGTGANSARAYFMPVFYGGGIDISF